MAPATYHHGNLRQALLEHAVDLARAGGPETSPFTAAPTGATAAHDAAIAAVARSGRAGLRGPGVAVADQDAAVGMLIGAVADEGAEEIGDRVRRRRRGQPKLSVAVAPARTARDDGVGRFDRQFLESHRRDDVGPCGKQWFTVESPKARLDRVLPRRRPRDRDVAGWVSSRIAGRSSAGVLGTHGPFPGGEFGVGSATSKSAPIRRWES